MAELAESVARAAVLIGKKPRYNDDILNLQYSEAKALLIKTV
jgi:hypothetical protein